MTTFRVSGSSRQVGAIGLPEPFTAFIQAESSQEAYTQARERQYSDNRELVQITEIEADWNDSGEYTHIEPRAYLEY